VSDPNIGDNMPQYKSEVMVNYATIMQDQDSMRKDAFGDATGRYLTKSLGVEALVVAVPASIAAAKGGGAMATIGAGLGSSAVPGIGWIIGGALLAVGVIWAINDAMNQTDDNIDDLIGRLEALDYEGTNAEATVESWIAILQGKQKFFQTASTAGAENEEEAILVRAQSQIELGKTMKILNTMKKEYPTLVAPYLEDWKFFPFNDPADFTETLDNVIADGKQRLKNIQRQGYAAGKKLIESTKKPDALMTEINDLDSQITAAWAKPEYTPEETKALEIGSRIAKRKVNAEEYADALPVLSSIRDQLKRLLPQAERRSKKAELESSPISKRAVKLPDKPSAPGVTPRPISKRPRIPRNDVVEDLQRYLNHLNVSLQVPSEYLKEDARYGPKTADALAKTLNVVGQMNTNFLRWLQNQGVPVARIREIQFMNNNPRFITIITREIGKMVEAIRAGEPTDVKDVTFGKQRPTKPSARPSAAPVDTLDDIGRKQNPSDPEILAYFQGLHGTIGGGRVNLYDYAQQNLGMSDSDILRLIHGKFPGWAPKAWSVPIIIDAMGQKYSVLY
jgi:hypothetical protein